MLDESVRRVYFVSYDALVEVRVDLCSKKSIDLADVPLGIKHLIDAILSTYPASSTYLTS